MKKISIRSKLYINIVPIIIIGVIASFAALYYIANEKYSDYLYDQYEYDIEYLKDISVEIIQNGTIPSDKYIRLPDSCAGIRVYNLNDNLIYTKVSKDNMMNDISCCDFISYEIEGYGRLEIYSHCAIEHTEDSIGFRKGLIWAVIIAGFITVLITILVINRMANRMSKELNGVSEYAGKMETGIMETSIDTNIVEIDNINSSLHNLGVRLAEKERLRKEKIDLIKHQLSTPLTIIKTTLEGMMDDVVELDKEYIERCITENDRIKEKLESLYVDIESNTETIKKEKTNLKDLINEIVDSFSVSFGQKGVKLVTDLEDLIIETDKNLLIASIYNILSNSYKYTDEGDTVTITIDGKLRISDTGNGISEQDREKIFDAYYRGNNTADLKGKGLGLYDSRNNLEKLGYKIFLDKEQKQTTFVIDFQITDKS